MVFLGFPTVFFFFLSFSLNLYHQFNTQNHTHTETHDTPINLFKPITTHTHTHTNTNHQTLKTQKPVRTNTNTHTHKQTQKPLKHTHKHKPIKTKTQKNPSHHCSLLTKIPPEQKPILKIKINK